MSTCEPASPSIALAYDAAHHVASQNPAPLNYVDEDQHEGYPPQKSGARYPDNIGAPVSFFTPLTSPPSGQRLDRKGSAQAKLFEPVKIRDVTLKNRIIVSPMCQYSCKTSTGLATDWHLVHQGQFSIRGASVVFTEAAGVLPNGGITPQDAGIWSDDHIPGWKRVTEFHRSQGALSAMQLSHAGRKGSTYAPWLTDGLIAQPPMDLGDSQTVPKELGGHEVWGPSAIRHSDALPMPREMSNSEVRQTVQAFVDAAVRSVKAGYDIIEIHGAHGYLIHEFVSPLSNQRTDEYGGSFENRVRFPLEIVRAVRKAIPAGMPLFYRVSGTDWHEAGEYDGDKAISWGIRQTIELAKLLKAEGVDLLDISSGGNDQNQKIEVKPGYQVPLAEAAKKDSSLKGLLIGTVGLITDGKQAEGILQEGRADVVMLARELLRHADFVADAAYDLGVTINTPVQYQRAHTRMYK